MFGLLLNDGRGNTFELLIPKPGSTHDHEWADITIRVACSKGSFSASDESLTVVELPRLARWLISHAAGGPKDTPLDFMEPCLAFHSSKGVGGRVRIRVVLQDMLSPPWVNPRKPEDPSTSSDVLLEMRPSAVAAAGRHFLEEINRFHVSLGMAPINEDQLRDL